MRKIILSAVVISSFAFAGGGFKDVEPAVEPVVPIVVEEVSPFYVGLGLSGVSTGDGDLDIFSEKVGRDRTGDILAMAGYEFNPYIALEGRYMTSVFDEDFLTRDSWGIYAKPQYPLTGEFSLYALIGYGGLNVDGKGLSLTDVSDTGFQWGLGASYEVIENIAIFADYVSIAKDMDADIFRGSLLRDVSSDAFTLGATYNF